MKERRKPFLFKTLEFLVKVFYKKYQIVYEEEVTSSGNIFVANHAQIHGPIASYLYYPKSKKIWVIGEMTKLKEVPDYAFEDFWRDKPKITHWFFRLLSFVIAPLSVFIMKHANTIPVYKDMRVTKTFKDSINTLHNNVDIFLYPECRQPYNHIINDFQVNFIDLARIYYKKHQKELKFYPVYICKSLRKILIGRPTTFNFEANINEERQRISQYLKEHITRLALSLPSHKVVPYTNGAKRAKSK